MLFTLIFCNCYIIVFSLVDFKPGGRGFKSRLCQTFFFFLLFFSLFLFLNTKRVFWVQNRPSPSPHTFFHFLNIVQYLLVHCTIPSILDSHPPPTDPPPTPPPPIFFLFFLNFHKNFSSSFTSTLTPHPDPTPPPTHPPTPPPTPPPKFFF